MLYYRCQIEKYPIRHFSSKMISWNFVNGGDRYGILPVQCMHSVSSYA